MPKYITVKDAAKKWDISQPLVRRYCASGRVPNAICENGTWLIPEKAPKPRRQATNIVEEDLLPLAKKLVQQKKKKNYHGLYDYVQIDFTYSSSRMASNRLTREQVESIFRKGKVRESFEPLKVSDLVEVMNHCVCVDYILDHINEPLTHSLIQHIHYLLMFGTVDHRKNQVTPGVYRVDNTKRCNRPMVTPTRINTAISTLVSGYEANREPELVDILDFHVSLERITPFDDGNGRTGRLIMFKECLRYGIMPFILDDKRRSKYIAGIQTWDEDRTTLMQVVNEAQVRFGRQVERHKLAEYRQPEFMNIMDSDEVDDD